MISRHSYFGLKRKVILFTTIFPLLIYYAAADSQDCRRNCCSLLSLRMQYQITPSLRKFFFNLHNTLMSVPLHELTKRNNDLLIRSRGGDRMEVYEGGVSNRGAECLGILCGEVSRNCIPKYVSKGIADVLGVLRNPITTIGRSGVTCFPAMDLNVDQILKIPLYSNTKQSLSILLNNNVILKSETAELISVIESILGVGNQKDGFSRQKSLRALGISPKLPFSTCANIVKGLHRGLSRLLTQRIEVFGDTSPTVVLLPNSCGSIHGEVLSNAVVQFLNSPEVGAAPAKGTLQSLEQLQPEINNLFIPQQVMDSLRLSNSILGQVVSEGWRSLRDKAFTIQGRAEVDLSDILFPLIALHTKVLLYDPTILDGSTPVFIPSGDGPQRQVEYLTDIVFHDRQDELFSQSEYHLEPRDCYNLNQIKGGTHPTSDRSVCTGGDSPILDFSSIESYCQQPSHHTVDASVGTSPFVDVITPPQHLLNGAIPSKNDNGNLATSPIEVLLTPPHKYSIPTVIGSDLNSLSKSNKGTLASPNKPTTDASTATGDVPVQKAVEDGNQRPQRYPFLNARAAVRKPAEKETQPPNSLENGNQKYPLLNNTPVGRDQRTETQPSKGTDPGDQKYPLLNNVPVGRDQSSETQPSQGNDQRYPLLNNTPARGDPNYEVDPQLANGDQKYPLLNDTPARGDPNYEGDPQLANGDQKYPLLNNTPARGDPNYEVDPQLANGDQKYPLLNDTPARGDPNYEGDPQLANGDQKYPLLNDTPARGDPNYEGDPQLANGDQKYPLLNNTPARGDPNYEVDPQLANGDQKYPLLNNTPARGDPNYEGDPQLANGDQKYPLLNNTPARGDPNYEGDPQLANGDQKYPLLNNTPARGDPNYEVDPQLANGDQKYPLLNDTPARGDPNYEVDPQLANGDQKYPLLNNTPARGDPNYEGDPQLVNGDQKYPLLNNAPVGRDQSSETQPSQGNDQRYPLPNNTPARGDPNYEDDQLVSGDQEYPLLNNVPVGRNQSSETQPSQGTPARGYPNYESDPQLADGDRKYPLLNNTPVGRDQSSETQPSQGNDQRYPLLNNTLARGDPNYPQLVNDDQKYPLLNNTPVGRNQSSETQPSQGNDQKYPLLNDTPARGDPNYESDPQLVNGDQKYPLLNNVPVGRNQSSETQPSQGTPARGDPNYESDPQLVNSDRKYPLLNNTPVGRNQSSETQPSLSNNPSNQGYPLLNKSPTIDVHQPDQGSSPLDSPQFPNGAQKHPSLSRNPASGGFPMNDSTDSVHQNYPSLRSIPVRNSTDDEHLSSNPANAIPKGIPSDTRQQYFPVESKRNANTRNANTPIPAGSHVKGSTSIRNETNEEHQQSNSSPAVRGSNLISNSTNNTQRYPTGRNNEQLYPLLSEKDRPQATRPLSNNNTSVGGDIDPIITHREYQGSDLTSDCQQGDDDVDRQLYPLLNSHLGNQHIEPQNMAHSSHLDTQPKYPTNPARGSISTRSPIDSEISNRHLSSNSFPVESNRSTPILAGSPSAKTRRENPLQYNHPVNASMINSTDDVHPSGSPAESERCVKTPFPAGSPLIDSQQEYRLQGGVPVKGSTSIRNETNEEHQQSNSSPAVRGSNLISNSTNNTQRYPTELEGTYDGNPLANSQQEYTLLNNTPEERNTFLNSDQNTTNCEDSSLRESDIPTGDTTTSLVNNLNEFPQLRTTAETTKKDRLLFSNSVVGGTPDEDFTERPSLGKRPISSAVRDHSHSDSESELEDYFNNSNLGSDQPSLRSNKYLQSRESCEIPDDSRLTDLPATDVGRNNSNASLNLLRSRTQKSQRAVWDSQAADTLRNTFNSGGDLRAAVPLQSEETDKGERPTGDTKRKMSTMRAAVPLTSNKQPVSRLLESSYALPDELEERSHGENPHKTKTNHKRETYPSPDEYSPPYQLRTDDTLLPNPGGLQLSQSNQPLDTISPDVNYKESTLVRSNQVSHNMDLDQSNNNHSRDQTELLRNKGGEMKRNPTTESSTNINSDWYAADSSHLPGRQTDDVISSQIPVRDQTDELLHSTELNTPTEAISSSSNGDWYAADSDLPQRETDDVIASEAPMRELFHSTGDESQRNPTTESNTNNGSYATDSDFPLRGEPGDVISSQIPVRDQTELLHSTEQNTPTEAISSSSNGNGDWYAADSDFLLRGETNPAQTPLRSEVRNTDNQNDSTKVTEETEAGCSFGVSELFGEDATSDDKKPFKAITATGGYYRNGTTVRHSAAHTTCNINPTGGGDATKTYRHGGTTNSRFPSTSTTNNQPPLNTVSEQGTGRVLSKESDVPPKGNPTAVGTQNGTNLFGKPADSSGGVVTEEDICDKDTISESGNQRSRINELTTSKEKSSTLPVVAFDSDIDDTQHQQVMSSDNGNQSVRDVNYEVTGRTVGVKSAMKSNKNTTHGPELSVQLGGTSFFTNTTISASESTIKPDEFDPDSLPNSTTRNVTQPGLYQRPDSTTRNITQPGPYILPLDKTNNIKLADTSEMYKQQANDVSNSSFKLSTITTFRDDELFDSNLKKDLKLSFPSADVDKSDLVVTGFPVNTTDIENLLLNNNDDDDDILKKTIDYDSDDFTPFEPRVSKIPSKKFFPYAILHRLFCAFFDSDDKGLVRDVLTEMDVDMGGQNGFFPIFIQKLSELLNIPIILSSAEGVFAQHNLTHTYEERITCFEGNYQHEPTLGLTTSHIMAAEKYGIFESCRGDYLRRIPGLLSEKISYFMYQEGDAQAYSEVDTSVISALYWISLMGSESAGFCCCDLLKINDTVPLEIAVSIRDIIHGEELSDSKVMSYQKNTLTSTFLTILPVESNPSMLLRNYLIKWYHNTSSAMLPLLQSSTLIPAAAINFLSCLFDCSFGIETWMFFMFVYCYTGDHEIFRTQVLRSLAGIMRYGSRELCLIVTQNHCLTFALYYSIISDSKDPFCSSLLLCLISDSDCGLELSAVAGNYKAVGISVSQFINSAGLVRPEWSTRYTLTAYLRILEMLLLSREFHCVAQVSPSLNSLLLNLIVDERDAFLSQQQFSTTAPITELLISVRLLLFGSVMSSHSREFIESSIETIIGVTDIHHCQLLSEVCCGFRAVLLRFVGDFKIAMMISKVLPKLLTGCCPTNNKSLRIGSIRSLIQLSSASPLICERLGDVMSEKGYALRGEFASACVDGDLPSLFAITNTWRSTAEEFLCEETPFPLPVIPTVFWSTSCTQPTPSNIKSGDHLPRTDMDQKLLPRRTVTMVAV